MSTSEASARSRADSSGARAATDGVRQIAVPPDARALSTLSRIDYEDAFLVDIDAGDRRTAEQWARAILDEAPRDVRARLWCAWKLLGLRLGAPWSDRLVLGWEIRRNGPDLALLGARSRIGMPAELLVRRQDDTLLFCTFVQKDNALARAAWAAVDRKHPPVVREVLERARARRRRR